MGLAACCGPIEAPDTAEQEELEVELQPRNEPGGARIVTRFVVRPAPRALASAALFSGELSAYHLRRVATGELPQTLVERQVPVQAWRQDDYAIVAPEAVLDAAQDYSLVLGGRLLVHITTVGPDKGTPVLRRLWPPVDSEGEPIAIYCGADPGSSLPRSILMGPGGVEAVVMRGVALGVRDDDCVTLRAEEKQPVGAVLVPPPQLGRALLDPAPLRTARGVPVEGSSCPAPGVRLGPGCARIEDDRLQVEAGDRSWLWVLRGTNLADARVVSETAVVFKGLDPGASNELDIAAFDDGGRRFDLRVRVDTMVRQPHVVINEVMANPIGKEPEQEWIELYNDGNEAVDLEGWTIEDAGGSCALPSYWLEARAYVLVVASGYDRNSRFDIRPDADVELIELPELGTSGLRNSGEPLVLIDPFSTVRSTFPAMSAADEGHSLARLNPEAVDVPPSFAVHADPGASPGSSNSTR